ncbi:hypothetical protein J4526_09485 [Desulfurococcaceae archaeon MEX13E-LK6-19]|nr:hypothetical protein J4526_09485 [Desulfurococcaceae archaeon MEX13E-LK6-19]
MDPKSYMKNWYGSNQPTIADKIRSFLKPDNEPLAKKAITAHYRIKSALSRVKAYIDRLNEKDKELFEKAVEALIKRDEVHAKMYVNEVAEIRKIAKQLLMVEYVLEQASLRLETIMILGQAFGDIAPVVSIIKDAGSLLRGIAPDIWIELTMAANDLSTVLAATGVDLGGETSISLSQEAKKIFEAARIAAEQKIKEAFPDLPTTLSLSTKESAEKELLESSLGTGIDSLDKKKKSEVKDLV